MNARLLALALLAPLSLCASACDDDGGSLPEEEGGGGGGGGGVDPGNATFAVRESVGQLQVFHATPGTKLELRNAADETLQLAETDHLGSHVFREVPPGEGYVIRTVGADPEEHTGPLTVLSVEGSTPPQEFYDSQELVPGFQYLTTRDGTKLSVYITMPGPPEQGPYPTVVNYSGYDPSRPGEPVQDGAYEALCGELPTLCAAPADPSALIASFMGYATVGVNMRGTGCSGGAFDFFEPLQRTDGYDIVETVAAQPWVKHGKVGMTGLSYPGISQLFVGAQQPPSLAAIAPLSVLGNTATTLYPGGILNNGFALLWADRVLDRAGPYGQGWEQERVDGGDTICAENQLLHDQRVDIIQKAREQRYYDPVVVDPLNPTLFVDRIEVPVFLSGSFQDEQTGPYFTTLLDKFAGAPVVKLTVMNGVHPDGFSPQLLIEWKAFLDLYVAQEVPSLDPTVRNLAPLLFEEIFRAQLPFPPDRFTEFTSWEEAKEAYEAEPSVRVILENGAEDPLGAPHGSGEVTFASWPPPPTEARRFYFQPDGSMGDDPPTEDGVASRFLVDPFAGYRGVLAPGGDIWDTIPAWDWRQPEPGSAVVFEGAPLAETILSVGTASADLWVKTDAGEADLEVTLSEVRPDGNETFVQAGWLRVSQRKLADHSTELWPEPTHLEADAAPPGPGEWVEARVAIPGYAHVFREGSRIRVAIDTPGDSKSDWRFELARFPGPATHAIGHGAGQPSSLVIPVVPDGGYDKPLPPCPSLRGQPCRAHVPYVNERE